MGKTGEGLSYRMRPTVAAIIDTSPQLYWPFPRQQASTKELIFVQDICSQVMVNQSDSLIMSKQLCVEHIQRQTLVAMKLHCIVHLAQKQ